MKNFISVKISCILYYIKSNFIVTLNLRIGGYPTLNECMANKYEKHTKTNKKYFKKIPSNCF